MDISHKKLIERCWALEITLDHTKQQICACDVVIKSSCATTAILGLHVQKLQDVPHTKEECQKQKETTIISLNVGDGAVGTEDNFIKRVEAKKKVQEEKRKEQEGRRKLREKRHMLRNTLQGASEVVCGEYEAKVNGGQVCQELMGRGVKVYDPFPKPKRCPQKEVFEEVRQRWKGELEANEDLMDVDVDVGEFDDDCKMEVLSSYGESDSSNGEEGQGDNESEDLMDIDKA